MTNQTTPPNHLHFFNHHTGHPRFHFDEAADAAAASAAAAAAAAAKPWHDGIDTELIGHAQNKGWKLDTPKDAFAASAKVARDLEKHFGVPADRLVKLPGADAKAEDIRAYYERIGAPKDAKDYDLSAIKDAPIADSLRATLYDKGVPKDAATAVAASVAKALESQVTTQTTLDAAKLTEQKTRLEKNWGGKDSPTYQFNHLNAVAGARRVGLNEEGATAAENLIGYDNLMEVLRKIGAHTREDTFVERGVGGQGDVTTMEGAVARKTELMADPAWSKRYLDGGVTEKREMDRLNQMITGVAA